MGSNEGATSYPLTESEVGAITIFLEVTDLWKQAYLDHMEDIIHSDQISVNHHFGSYYKRGVRSKFWVDIIRSIYPKFPTICN